jgi:hypothetical protein
MKKIASMMGKLAWMLFYTAILLPDMSLDYMSPVYILHQLFSKVKNRSLSALDSCVIGMLLNKSKSSNFMTIKSPPCGGHVVINDVGQHHKWTWGVITIEMLILNVGSLGSISARGVLVRNGEYRIFLWAKMNIELKGCEFWQPHSQCAMAG